MSSTNRLQLPVKIQTFRSIVFSYNRTYILQLAKLLRLPAINIYQTTENIKLSLLKSPHVHKKAQTQFGQKTYKLTHIWYPASNFHKKRKVISVIRFFQVYTNLRIQNFDQKQLTFKTYF